MTTNLTLSSRCYEQIRQLILSGELRPGERIKGEYLRNRLGCGLSPLREALSRLTGRQLVEIVDNVGFSVASLSKDKVYDIFHTYAKIESVFLRESIELGDDDWEAKIMATLYSLSKLEVENNKVAYQLWNSRNDAFHEALISGRHLAGLKSIYQDYLVLKEWCFNLAYPNLNQELVAVNHAEHAKIAELAIKRKSDAACAMLYKHSLHNLDVLTQRLMRNGCSL